MLKNKLVCGVGVNDSNTPVYIEGRPIPSYNCWKAMLNRCYGKKYQLRKPTYRGCVVHQEWLSFQNFQKYYEDNYKIGFQLDKDILIPNNKVYCKEYCRFIPSYINSIFNDCGSARGQLPMGVRLQSSKRKVNNTYQGHCSDNNGGLLTKTFKTIEEASIWYSETKTRLVREVATRALEAGDIQQDIFDALVARKF